MTKRIFIAITLPEDIKKKLVKYQEKIEGLFALPGNEVSHPRPIKWIKKENIHITLLFLGYLDENQLLETIKITKEIVSFYDSFFIVLDQYCYGPPNKKPRQMVWVKIAKNLELLALQRSLEETLFSLPLFQYKQKQCREYLSHITLGRIKQWEFNKLEPEQRPKINEKCSLKFSVNSIKIVESELERTGAKYTILKTYNLKPKI